MSERKGHRKLRLCSRKRYELNKYRPKSLEIKVPLAEVNVFAELAVSIPVAMFHKAVSPNIANLLCRLKQLDALPQGLFLVYCLLKSNLTYC